MNIKEYINCTDKKARADYEEHIFENVFYTLMSMLPLNPPEIEIDGESKVREEIWTDGTEILCANEDMADRVADWLDAISGEMQAHTGYYDPYDDANNGEVDDHTGFYYVDFD